MRHLLDARLTPAIKEIYFNDVTKQFEFTFDFEDIAKAWCKTGSYWMTTEPEKANDIDFCVLLKEPIPKIDLAAFWDNNQLEELGYYEHLDDIYDEDPNKPKFMSYRKHSINLIVTEDPEFFKGFRAASIICKTRNLLKKEDRVKLFEEVFEARKTKKNDLMWV